MVKSHVKHADGIKKQTCVSTLILGHLAGVTVPFFHSSRD